MYSLCGGRWPARKRATSDPTARKSPKRDGAKGLRYGAKFNEPTSDGKSR
jgi:hypothetical protein